MATNTLMDSSSPAPLMLTGNKKVMSLLGGHVKDECKELGMVKKKKASLAARCHAAGITSKCSL